MHGNYIDVIIDNQPVHALVDSGASFSIMSDEYRHRLKKTTFQGTRNLALKVADGKYVHPIGRCIARLGINDRTQPFEFVVLPKCSHDLILGWDFLAASNAVIDCERSEIIIDKAESLDQLQEEKQSQLFVMEDYCIPPRSAMSIVVTGPCLEDTSTVLVEVDKSLPLHRELMVPVEIINLSCGKGKVWVMNGHAQAQIIPKGMRLCNAQSLERNHLNPIEEDFNPSDDPSGKEGVPLVEPKMSTSLDEDQRRQLCLLLSKFPGAFGGKFKENPDNKDRPVKHRINTGDHPAVSQKFYRVSPTERRVIQEEVDKMLEKDVIKESESPWSSPVVLVKKKDGSWRFCVDYRRLNSITKKDVYPLPRIDDTLDCLSGAAYFSSMDLQSGYWQIEVDEADREKTAFITPEGLYEFKVMPFGLCNAPATFERMMDNLLRHLKWTMCLCYLDDIIVFSKTFEDHLSRLSAVLGCIEKAGLCLNPKKCLFAAPEIKVLGHLVNGNGVRPDPDKIKAITDFPSPCNIRDVKSFLGICSYYRRFIKDFCIKARPLQELLKGDAVFSWEDDQERSFAVLKAALTSDPVLGLFDEKAATNLHADASGYGLGAVLNQVQNNSEKVIAYASRVLSKPERNYSTTERECLAIIWSITKFRPYLFGRPFTIVTDHHSLCWLANLKDPSGRLARWALRLQEYDVTIVYKSGRKHQDADCLSRCPIEDDTEIAEEIPTLNAVADIAAEQRDDVETLKVIKSLEGNEPNQGKFQMVDGILCKRNFDPLGAQWLPVIPKQLREDILRHFHDEATSGHLGFARTYDRIRKRYHWPGLYRSVKRYVSHCRECQRRKSVPQLPPGQLIPIPPAVAPFHRVGIDLLGRFPKTSLGNRWIIVCTDYLTRFATTKVLPSADAPVVAKFLVEDVILRHGAPRIMISDRGTVFQSKLVAEITTMCNVSHKFTTAYHPQTNGLTERFNKTLADMLSMYVDAEQRDWDDLLPFVTFAYNTAKQETTGFTPFFLLHGREAETTMDTLFPYHPIDTGSDYVSQLITTAEEARQLARIRTLSAQDRDRQRYDAKHRPVSYNPGDLVWIFIPIRKVGLSEKLLKRYFGPYCVKRRLSDVNYEVENFDPTSRRRKQKDVVHVLRMKPYLDPDTQLHENDQPCPVPVRSLPEPLNETSSDSGPTPATNDLVPKVRECTGAMTRSRKRELERS